MDARERVLVPVRRTPQVERQTAPKPIEELPPGWRPTPDPMPARWRCN